MKLSAVFEEKPEVWGLRGDPYFWDFLKDLAKDIETLAPDELEGWVRAAHFAVSGKVLSPTSMVRVERFAHGGMSSGGVDGAWWTETGIPLLKSRL